MKRFLYNLTIPSKITSTRFTGPETKACKFKCCSRPNKIILILQMEPAHSHLVRRERDLGLCRPCDLVTDRDGGGRLRGHCGHSSGHTARGETVEEAH